MQKGSAQGYQIVKRALDVTVSASVLVASSPLVAFIAWRIKASGDGPLLYRGRRVGRDGVCFEMLKFRTMVVDAEALGGPSTSNDDHRLTHVGRSLRRWKLDELPQLWNVVRGEMSLVGPRPQVESDVARYTPDERHLLDVRPGITDWASVRFSNEGAILAGHADPDEAYDRLIRPEKLALGLRYVREASIRTDLAILCATLRTLLPTRSRGAQV